MAFFATCYFLEKVEDDFWSLEFPACIPGEGGRPFLYKVASYFRLAHHTVGKSGKNRRTIMYPGSQFKDKQEQENNEKWKEARKLQDKFEKFGFTDIPLGAQGTWREGYIAALIQAKKEKKEPPTEFDFTNTFVPASPEEFVAHLKPLVEQKMAELKKSEFFQESLAVEASEAKPEAEAPAQAEAESAPKPKKKKKNKKKPAAPKTEETEETKETPPKVEEVKAPAEPI